MHANSAIKCFNENRVHFGNARTQPEKFNLYNGLSSLAKAVKELQDEVDKLRREVAGLRNR